MEPLACNAEEHVFLGCLPGSQTLSHGEGVGRGMRGEVSRPPPPGTPLESQLLPRAPESSPLPSAAPSLFPADVLLPSPEGDENRGRGAKRNFKQHLIKHGINFF